MHEPGTDSTSEEAAGEADTVKRAVTVLVVDDDLTVGATVWEILEDAGYHVLLAERGAEAVEILRTRSQPVDLVLLDWILPDMSGDLWLESILEIAPAMKVIFCSGKFSRGVTLEQLAPKAKGILRKPFTSAELLSAIRKALQ